MAKLLVGLGNPGKKYAKTRHNVGFLILDRLAEKWGVSLNREKFSGIFGEHRQDEEKIYLVKPQTFMNLSGECVQSWARFLKLEPGDLLVTHDELDLPLGRMKAQWAAGPAGHQGVTHIVDRLGHQDFNRLRVGVGHPGKQKEVVDFVLSPFSAEEQPLLEEVLDQAVHALETFVQKGLDAVARMVNRRDS
jgi:peptidyl-tRNA hydrolase, PTH1 family